MSLVGDIFRFMKAEISGWIKDLSSGESEKIDLAVAGLIASGLDFGSEEALSCLVANDWSGGLHGESKEGVVEDDDDDEEDGEEDPAYFAPIWAAIVLGRVGSQHCVIHLLEGLDRDDDLYNEAIAEALTQLASRFGESILEPIEVYIETHLNDEDSPRLFAYEAISILTESDRAKRFLIRMLEDDEDWAASVAVDLAPFGDKRLRSLIVRKLEFAKQTQKSISENELRYAYAMLEGALPVRSDDSWKENWRERWSHIFKMMEMDNEEYVKWREDTVGERFAKWEAKQENKKVAGLKEESDILQNLKIKPFDFGEYLSVRERGSLEMGFERILRLVGLSDRWNVEMVQKLINDSKMPKDVFSKIFDGGKVSLPSEDSLAEFTQNLMDLWNKTPRNEFNGISPYEMAFIGRHLHGSDQNDII